jgi:aminoglycoside phosphotransferase (APT) family kinase protein
VEDAEVIDCVCAAAGHAPCAGRVIPLSGKQGLLICRVTLQNGRSYVFKAVKEVGRREIAISELLSKELPGSVPHVYAAEQDCKRGLYWFVCEDVGSRRLADSPTVDAFAATAVALARVQLASLEISPALWETGAPVVDTARWEEIGLRLLEAAEKRQVDVGLDVAALEQVVWSVTSMAADASACPPALVHGDLHTANVAFCGEPENPSIRLLDWGSAYLGAAFLGLEELLWPAARYLRTPDQRGRVRAAYLREWAPLLGKPGPLETAVAACAALVRLELLDEALRRRHQYDNFAAAAIERKLFEAFEAWKRA